MHKEIADDEDDETIGARARPMNRSERERSYLLKEAVREVMGSDEEQKQLLKEAIQEWLDAKLLAFGKWTIYGCLAMALAGMCLLLFVKFGISLEVKP